MEIAVPNVTIIDTISRSASRKDTMNKEKVIFAFFIVLALTLNFGFFLGEISNPLHHNVYEYFAALVVSLICTVIKFGDRTHLGALMLATSLVADLQLVVGAGIWGYAEQISGVGMDPSNMSSVVSLSGGALLANIISVILLVVETAMLRR
jgi:protein-S-isoprenylcysteine O-methyltransferase Ste14